VCRGHAANLHVLGEQFNNREQFDNRQWLVTVEAAVGVVDYHETVVQTGR